MFYTTTEIPSDLSKISEIESFVRCIMQNCKMDMQYFGILCTPLIEAVKNAIIHGNHNDIHKKVKILCQQENEKWTFSVKDEGIGFSYEEYQKQRILGLSHGLSIISTLCDEIEFQNNGSTIIFTIQLPRLKQEVPQREWAHEVIKQYLPQLV